MKFMQNNNPLVSIIIPTYNRAHLIGETLDSVLAQTYQNWECIIVDDGSTDNTEEVVSAYVDKDSRFQFYHRPDTHKSGGNGARNYGFSLSKGEYINWFDSDDIFSNNKIYSQVLLTVENNVEVLTCKWGRFQNDKNEFELKNLNIYKHYNKGVDLLEKYAVYNEFYPSHVFLVKRLTCMKAGLWNENLSINQDGEFFCRILIACKSLRHSADSYVLYRTPTLENVSSLKSVKQAEHLVISWKLIEQYLLLVDKTKFQNYLINAKNHTFSSIIKKYPEVIDENKYFYKTQIKNNLFFNKLTKRIIKKIF